MAAFLNSGLAAGSGFDKAIESATTRVVKLYGLGVGAQQGYGTGIVVSEGGEVLTVLSLLVDSRAILAVTYEGRRYQASVVHRDKALQLALLQLDLSAELDHERTDGGGTEAVGGAEPPRFFDVGLPARLKPGEWVLAAGNSFKVADGSEMVSIAHGVFSGRTRLDARRRARDFPYRGDVLVIDAITSNPGAPGSALVNLDGELVGMIGRTVASNLTHTHFNYAIPRDVLEGFVSEARAASASGTTVTARRAMGAESDRPKRDPGIRLTRAGYRDVLPFVERVRRDSPAARAGVRKDDLILSFNGRGVKNVAVYDAILEALSPDEPIELVLRRGRAIRTVRIEPRAD